MQNTEQPTAQLTVPPRQPLPVPSLHQLAIIAVANRAAVEPEWVEWHTAPEELREPVEQLTHSITPGQAVGVYLDTARLITTANIGMPRGRVTDLADSTGRAWRRTLLGMLHRRYPHVRRFVEIDEYVYVAVTVGGADAVCPRGVHIGYLTPTKQ